MAAGRDAVRPCSDGLSGEARPNFRSGGARGGVGARSPAWVALEPISRCAGPSLGRVRDGGQWFKGLTDELLRYQTEALLELETERRGIAVLVRPELVVEIAIDGVQASTRYKGGLALRFARVKRYRADKSAGEADTIDSLRELLH